MPEQERSEIIALSSKILRSYFCDNDVEFLISHMSPDIVWLGGGEDQRAEGKEAVAAFFRNGKKDLAPCLMSEERYVVSGLGPGFYLCEGESRIQIAPDMGMNMDILQRITFIYERQEGMWKIRHIHNSVPFSAVADGELFPAKAARESYDRLKHLLDERERQIELMLPQLPGGMAVCLPDDGYPIRLISSGLSDIFGYEGPRDFIQAAGGRYIDFIHPDDRDEVCRQIDGAYAQNQPFVCEYRAIRKDGSSFWVMETGKRVRDENGVPVLACFITDVTERKNQESKLIQANMEIRRQAEFLTQLYQTIPCGIIQFTTDSSHRIINANRRAWEIYGYGEKEYWDTVKDPFPFVLEKEQGYFRQMVDSLSQSGGSVSYEREGIRRDGSHCWVNVSMERLVNADGEPVIQAVFSDITEIRQLQREREQEQLLENRMLRAAILTAYPLILSVNLTQNTYTTTSSDGFITRRVTAGSYDGLVWDTFEDIHPSDQAEYQDFFPLEVLLQRLGAAPEAYWEFRQRGDDGEYHWVSAHVIRVENPYGSHEYCIILLRVLDEQRAEKARQEQLLRDALASAEAANSAKSDFLSRMSHDIRTPMNAIVGMSAIGQLKLDDRDRVLDCFQKIDSSSRYLLSLINDILDMSKIESGKMSLASQKFDLTELISNVTSIIYPQAEERGLDFEVIHREPLARWYMGDPLRMNQILMNLLSNALKFTPAGGKITLRLREARSAAGRSRLEFVVSDTGMGISPEFMKNLYKPFEQERADQARNQIGSGLGLSIVYNLVQLMGGVIDVQSELGKGTVFTLVIPFGQAEAEKEEIHGSAGTLHGLEVLVVDDDGMVGEQAAAILTGIGARSRWVDSGEKAVEEVRRALAGGHSFDLALIDWKMPDMDGIETTRQIRRLVGPDTMIIIISAYDWSGIESEAREAGVDSFIPKPLFQSTIRNTLTWMRASHHEPSALPPAEYGLASMRVLLTEDNALNMEIARSLLEMQGVTVDAAENGREAVDRFSAAPEGTYQAVLMDIRMPVMDGLAAARAIRALPRKDAKTTPILAMSANAFEEDRALAMEAGMDGYLVKPVDADVLFSALRDLHTQ